jgi:hypothetical protein
MMNALNRPAIAAPTLGCSIPSDHAVAQAGNDSIDVSVNA